jgi:hypothetical protein
MASVEEVKAGMARFGDETARQVAQIRAIADSMDQTSALLRGIIAVTDSARCYRPKVATKTAIALDDYVYESAKVCSSALGQSMTEWLNDAARSAARRQNAAAYLAWEAQNAEGMPAEIDEATANVSLSGAEW